MKKEIARKVIHSSLALFFAGGATILSKELLLLGVFLLFSIFLAMRVKRIRTHLHTVSRVSYGELFLPLGIGGAILLAWPNTMLFQIAMLVLAFADPLAALVGMRFGRHTYQVYDEQRSVEGSVSCAIALFCIFLICGVPLHILGILLFTLTGIEAISLRGSDNFFLPIATVLLYQFFS
jgi:phytol kinase